MELTVYERGTPVGTARLERDGIFWNFFCEMTDLTEQIRRVYVGTEWDVFISASQTRRASSPQSADICRQSRPLP